MFECLNHINIIIHSQLQKHTVFCTQKDKLIESVNGAAHIASISKDMGQQQQLRKS